MAGAQKEIPKGIIHGNYSLNSRSEKYKERFVD